MKDPVYVVAGETGEYSDNRWWLVRAFDVKDEADTFAKLINDWCVANGVHESNGHVKWPLRDIKCPHDPRFTCDSSGVKYYVAEVPREFAANNSEES